MTVVASGSRRRAMERSGIGMSLGCASGGPLSEAAPVAEFGPTRNPRALSVGPGHGMGWPSGKRPKSSGWILQDLGQAGAASEATSINKRTPPQM